MTQDMTPQEWIAFLSSLSSGAIKGALINAHTLEKSDPGKFPVVDDGTLFQVTAFLAAALIDAHPDYEDPAKFDDGADLIRNLTLEYLKTVRTMSGMGGQPLLHHLFKVAGAKKVEPPANLN